MKIKSCKVTAGLKIMLPVVIFCFISIYNTDIHAAEMPVLNFSDIVSGPQTGNTDGAGGLSSDEHGVIVTVWGNNLGSEKGNSQFFFRDSSGSLFNPAHIYYWTNADRSTGGPSDLFSYHKMQEVAFSIPAGTAEGEGRIFAEVDGVISNELEFTIRSGNIFFIKTDGDDSSGDGSWSKPFRTIDYIGINKNGNISPGDTVYVCDGVVETDGTSIRHSGTPVLYNSLIGYPGARATISGVLNSTGIHNWYGTHGYWVFSKIIVDTESTGIQTFSDMRIVGVEITGPEADGYGGAVGGADAGDPVDGMSGGGKFFGMYVHHFGNDETSEFHHTTYVSNRDGLPNKAYEYGWNYFRDNKAVHGFHIYDQSPGGDWTGIIKIYNNVVVNQKGPAVNIMSGGTEISVPVEIYNNLFINCGTGPDIGSFKVPKYAVSMTEGVITSDVLIFNNTFYGYGDNGIGAAVRKSFGGTVNLSNNIIIDTKNLPYVLGEPDINDSNLFYSFYDGHTIEIPTWAVNAIGENPLFVNHLNGDFNLQTGSPAIDHGASAVSDIVNKDFFNTPRPQNYLYDIGAFEYQIEQYGTLDINNDNKLNIIDVVLCVNAVKDGLAADADNNGQTDINDIALIVSTILIK